MQGTSEKRAYQGNSSSSTKKWLVGIFSFLVALDVLRFIGAITGGNGSAIAFSLIGLVLDGVMLTAIIKQWRVVLNVGRIILIIQIVLIAIAIVIGAIAISNLDSYTSSVQGISDSLDGSYSDYFSATVHEATDLQKSMLIAVEVIFSIGIICNIWLVVLLGRYNTELENASYA